MTPSTVSKRTPFIALILSAVAVSSAFAQANSYKAELDAFFKAFQTKNYALIKPLLDPRVKIAELPQGFNDQVVPQVLDKVPAPTSYSIESSTEKDGSTTVNTICKFEGKPDSKQSFVFNSNGKITAFDLPNFIGARAETRMEERVASESAPRQVRRPNRIEIPFELVNNVPLVTAEVNGKKGYFLLDSGAPDFSLNSEYLDKAQLKKSNSFAMGVGGAFEMKTSHVNSFNWQGLTMSNFDAYANPMSQLETLKAPKVLGLIGYQVYKDYEMTLDYDRKKLILVRTGENGVPFQKALTNRQVLDVIHFKMNAHTPVFPMTLAGKIYQMGLDTGAGGNLLFAKYYLGLKNTAAFVPGSLRQGQLGGIGSHVSTANTAQVKKTMVGKVPYKDMSFAFEDATLDAMNSLGLKIDGLLGYELLKQYPTSINFKAGTITVFARA